jgi:ribosomal protein L11 methylase PrmA
MVTCEYVPIPEEAARKMLRAVNLKPGELLFDLGCGSGDILIIAAEEFGARCVGIEMNQRLVDWAKEDVEKRGLQEKVTIFRDNFFSPQYWAHMNKEEKPHAVRNADVVTMYLTLQVQDALKERLEKELRPGARVASYAFKLSDWKPVKEIPTDEAPIYVFEKGRSF